MTKPSCENIAATNLQRQGYPSYLPRYIPAKTGAKVQVLFPRYIFIDIAQRWCSITGTYGISRLLLANGKPAIIAEKIISDLRAKEDRSGILHLQTKERFELGQAVKVAEGPLAGYSMLYDGMSGVERARVLIEMLGRKVLTVLDEKALVAA